MSYFIVTTVISVILSFLLTSIQTPIESVENQENKESIDDPTSNNPTSLF